MWKNEKLRYLRAPGDKVLTLVNGEVIETIDDLAEAINKIDPDTFEAHVNPMQNDFADWVQQAFGVTVLADLLRRYPTPLRMLVHIEAFLRLDEVPTAKP